MSRHFHALKARMERAQKLDEAAGTLYMRNGRLGGWPTVAMARQVMMQQALESAANLPPNAFSEGTPEELSRIIWRLERSALTAEKAMREYQDVYGKARQNILDEFMEALGMKPDVLAQVRHIFDRKIPQRHDEPFTWAWEGPEKPEEYDPPDLTDAAPGTEHEGMNDDDCVRFLQWALPRMGLRWEGYRKVRRGVCKRIARRIRDLGLAGPEDYRARLDSIPGEWGHLESLCRVSISRFYRDREVWERLENEVIPALAEEALGRGRPTLVAWSAGCASGEEPYTLSVLWRLRMAERFPRLWLYVYATDADARLLERANLSVYYASSLKELPGEWREAGFFQEGELFHLLPDFQSGVISQRMDLREEAPKGTFPLILCRNSAFTYLDEAGQRKALALLLERLPPGGWLVIGAHEALPPGEWPLRHEGGCFYRRPAD